MVFVLIVMGMVVTPEMFQTLPAARRRLQACVHSGPVIAFFSSVGRLDRRKRGLKTPQIQT
jgi:hypothetical protein